MRSYRRNGFSLMELVLVFAIMMILAAVAIPSFRVYMIHVRAAEAPAVLGTMARGQMKYWQTPFYDTAGSEIARQFVTAGPTPAAPAATKQYGAFLDDPNWRQIEFLISDSVYFSYLTYAVPPAGTTLQQRCEAEGDLDGDTTRSLFSLTVFGESTGEYLVRKSQYIHTLREHE